MGAVAQHQVPGIRLDSNLEMLTRDGVCLRAEVLRPEVATPVPAILCRTPYDKNLRFNAFAFLRPIDAAKAGFAVVFQDIRGRFASAGEWAIMGWDHVERQDGYDSVEWVARQPWCNGRVGMMGASYEGLNALSAATARPPGLRAIAPALLGAADARKTAMMLEGVVVSWSALMAVDRLQKLPADTPPDQHGLQRVLATLANPATAALTLPLDQLAPLTLPGMPTYEELTERITTSSAALIRDLDQIDVPSLWTTGWWDQAGGSDMFRCVRERGGVAARQESCLMIGPWSHTQHDASVGEWGFGQMSSLANSGVGAAHLAFFKRHLMDGEVVPLPTVRYFQTGSNRWRESGNWPPSNTVLMSYFLEATAGANSVIGDGRLVPICVDTPRASDRYVYDPASPVPSIGWRSLNLGGSTIAGPLNQAKVESRDDVLVYTSAVLGAPLAVVGDPRVRLFLSTDVADTDFMVKLCDVDLEGHSCNVADGFLRMRWRNGDSGPDFVVPGDVIEIEIDLGLTGHVFDTGHSLRLQVTSSAFPHIDRNMNTGERVGSDSQGRPATQTVYHSKRYPSQLILPVLGE